MDARFAGLMERWAEVRTLVDDAIPRMLEAWGERVPERLRDSMAYSAAAPGKRVRPLLVFLAGGSVPTQLLLQPALAVEMVHTYSLIHDDLPAMDDDALRRGRPTNHVQFDEATAILAGDALQTLAFELLTDPAWDAAPAGKLRCVRILARASGALGMVGGQADDMAAESAVPRPLLELLDVGSAAEFQTSDRAGQTLESLQDRKTGALIGAALLMGGVLAGAQDAQLRTLGRFGRLFGLLFQVTDDLLDITSTASALGKGVGKDADQGKCTWPGILGPDGARALADALADQCRDVLAGQFPLLAELAAWTVGRKA